MRRWKRLERANRAVEECNRRQRLRSPELERCEERLFALRAMGRKHQAPIEACRRWRENSPTISRRSQARSSEIGRLEAEVKPRQREPIAPRRPRSALRASEARASWKKP